MSSQVIKNNYQNRNKLNENKMH